MRVANRVPEDPPRSWYVNCVLDWRSACNKAPVPLSALGPSKRGCRPSAANPPEQSPTRPRNAAIPALQYGMDLAQDSCQLGVGHALCYARKVSRV